MPRPKCKYKTLAEVKAAFDAGEIPDGSKVMLDNDATNLYEPYDEATDSGECLWRGGVPDDVLTEALDLLGIPWGHV